MIKTITLRVDPWNPDPGVMSQAGEAIRRGQLVAFPTETVYGLAADAFNVDAVARVFEVKGRPANNPLPVQIASAGEIDRLVEVIPETARRLMAAFMPGPLTLVFEASSEVSEIITAKTGKVGIRMPDHPVALALIREAGTPIVAPSANTSGQTPPTTAQQVLGYLDGKVDVVLDAGPTLLKVASTVVDVTQTPLIVLRHGVIGEDDIHKIAEG